MRAVLRAQLLRPASRPNRTFFLFRHVFSSSRVSSSEPGTTAPINPSATSPVSQVEEEEDDEDISFDDLPPYRADPRDPDQFESLEELFDLENLPDFEEDDITSVGHLLLHERRTVLKYLRAIETEVPQLSQFRKPFVPKSLTTHPIIHRTISYGGEAHPADHKASVVAPISRLPLHTPAAKHKFKLLAGVRWSDVPPKDAGVASEDGNGNGTDGWIKIACEDYPEPRMNLKWCSDTLDKMIQEANDTSTDSFADIPQDTRHLEAKEKKLRGKQRAKIRPTIRDFPKEWLPSPSQSIPARGSTA